MYKHTIILLLFICTTSSIFVEASPPPSCLPCIDRSKVKIGVVHHGGPTDPFWTSMNIAIRQGAKDMGVRLLFNPREDELDQQEEIFTAMVKQIRKMCSILGDNEVLPYGMTLDTVDAILVSLPSSTIVDALDTCKTNNVTINTFNAGPDLAKEAGYLFFGQDETDAGYSAGEALAKVQSTEKFCCSNHAPGVDVLNDRCGGMKSGVEENEKSNTFDVPVDPNDCDAWKSAILESCTPDEGKDWSTVGLYLAGQANHKCGVEFLREYNAAYAVASDVSTDLYEGMKEGLNILFGIDQQSYLQGYLPFSHLTLAVTNDQMIENDYIQTGPHQVTEPPSEHFEECAENNFEVCSDDDDGSGGLQYCQCDSSNICIATGTNPVRPTSAIEDSQIRICLTSNDDEIQDITFLQITQTDSDGIQSTTKPEILFSASPIDPSLTVITLPDTDFAQGVSSATLFGQLSLKDAEESFQLDLELSMNLNTESAVPSTDESSPTTDDTSPTPSSRSLSQSTDYIHHITLAFGGIIMAIGGYLLAN